MGGKLGHLTDEEVIEDQDERLCEDSRIVGFTDQNRADLTIGAKAGNLRIYHHSLNPQKQLSIRRVVFTKGGQELRFRSVSEAAVKMKISRHYVDLAIARGIDLNGWKVKASHGL